MTLTALIAIYLVHLAAAISPGPAVLLAARTGMQEGMARGAWLSLGIGLGACVWALAAMCGLALLFELAPALLTTLKLVGAAYLMFLAWKMWRHAPEPITANGTVIASGRGPAGLVWQGILVQLTNPKPALFFGTVFLTFLPANAPLWGYGVVLGIVLFNDAGWNVIVSRIFSLERTRRAYLNLKTTIDRVFAGLLTALSMKLIAG